jgi:hypothetical protein
METFKIKISPEVLRNELTTQTYSGNTFGYYSGLSYVLSSGTVNLGTWNIAQPESAGNLISIGFEPIEGQTPIIWINKSGSTGYDWSFYFSKLKTGSTVTFIAEDGNRVNYITTQPTQEATTFFYLFLELVGDGITIPVGSIVELLITQPNTSQLIDLSIPILLEQNYEDIGYYSAWDGEISQLNDEVNFTFVFTNSNEITIYNTSDNKKTYLQESTYRIDWGDGTPIQEVTVFIPESVSHTYPTLTDVKSYTITFYGTTSLGDYVITKTVNVPYSAVQTIDSFLQRQIGPISRALQSDPTGDELLCGYQEYQDSLIQNKNTKEEVINIEEFTRNAIQNRGRAASFTTITIPVVFHIVYSQNIQNISDDLIYAQIDQLNIDFSASGPQIANTPDIFQPVGNMNLQFCLATQDPDGRPTNGITRKFTNVPQFSMGNGVQFESLGGVNAWPRDKYLNIWVCDINNYAGFAPGPGGPAATDGIVLDYETIGSMENPGLNYSVGVGRTATHEVGHWLNLKHIWGTGNGNCQSDDVDDTPTHDGPNSGCPVYPHYSSCPGNPVEMTMNFMDYSSQRCTWMFSPGQVLRARVLFEPGGPRYALASSTGCEPPFLPPTPTVDIGVTPTVTPTIVTTPTITVTPTIGVNSTPTPTPALGTNLTVEIENPYGEVRFLTKNGSWNTSPKSQNFINYFDALNTIDAQSSWNFVEVPYIISGFTQSRLEELKVYGINPYVNDLVINLPDGTTGVVTSQSPEYTAYTINDQSYIDFSAGTSVFVVQSYGFSEVNLTATTITKMEYLMNVIEQPIIQSNVFIERGKISGMENFRRIGEVNNTGSLRTYGYKFFDVRNYNDI